MSETKIRIGISKCLLGEKVRYDGQHKRDSYLVDTLGQFVEWVPVCPEVECGLPIPRKSMHLEGKEDDLRLVATKSKEDHTDKMGKYIDQKVPELINEGLSGFIFKKSSPSSGLHDAKYYTTAGMPYGRGPGLFAKAVIEAMPLLPCEDEGRMHDSKIRENFIERIFIMHRWNNMLSQENAKFTDLIEFHKHHKLILMAHSPKLLKDLGHIISNGKAEGFDKISAKYLATLMECLKLQTTVKKNVNVLQHIMGYFKKELDHDEKEELLEIIDEYHKGLIPLVVPITLLQHYVRKYKSEYLKEQLYLHPFPDELMLRNHV